LKKRAYIGYPGYFNLLFSLQQTELKEVSRKIHQLKKILSYDKEQARKSFKEIKAFRKQLEEKEPYLGSSPIGNAERFLREDMRLAAFDYLDNLILFIENRFFLLEFRMRPSPPPTNLPEKDIKKFDKPNPNNLEEKN